MGHFRVMIVGGAFVRCFKAVVRGCSFIELRIALRDYLMILGKLL